MHPLGSRCQVSLGTAAAFYLASTITSLGTVALVRARRMMRPLLPSCPRLRRNHARCKLAIPAEM